MHVTVNFRRDLFPLLRQFCRENGVSFNGAVNLAVQAFLGQVDPEELRLRAKIALLRRQEAELRQIMRVMLRSGSYLPQYADRLFREKYDRNEPSFMRRGQVPLKALNAREEDIARRVLAERERIAQEITDILDRLLPKKRFRLKPSRSRRRVKTTMEGGERGNAC